MQTSYCYKIGFGVRRDPIKAKLWRDALLQKEHQLKYPSLVRGRIYVDLTRPIDRTLETNTSLQALISRGLLSFSLADQLTVDTPIERVIEEIEAEGAARIVEFGDTSDSGLYYKMLLSILYIRVGRSAEAWALQNFVHQFYQQSDPFSLNALLVHEIVINSMRERGEIIEAKASQIELVQHTTRSCGADHPQTLSTISQLAMILCDLSEFVEAERLLIEVRKGRIRLFGEMHPSSIDALGDLVQLYRIQGRLNEAESQGRLALEQIKRISGPQDSQKFEAHTTLAATLLEQGALAESEEHFVIAFQGLKSCLSSSASRTLQTGLSLSTLYCHQRHFDQAENLIDSILETSRSAYGPRHAVTLAAAANMAAVKANKEEWGEAELMFLDVISEIGDENSTRLITPHSNLANMFSMKGDLEAAQHWYRKALLIARKICKVPHHMLAQIA